MKIDISLVGSRIKMIREQILSISQTELAIMITSKQNLNSRLEAGKGSNVNTILDIVKVL